MNKQQRIYLADTLKIAGTGQLGLIGIKHMYEHGRIGIPIFLLSLLILICSMLLGLKMLYEEEKNGNG